MEAKFPAAKYGCPQCHSAEFLTYPHEKADQQINELKIYCPKKNKGCQWTGKLNDITKHIIHGECQDIECDKCKEIICHTTGTLESHLPDCPCYCQYCKIIADKEEIISKHKDKCEKCPTMCTNCRKSQEHRNLIILIGLLIIIMLGWQCLCLALLF